MESSVGRGKDRRRQKRREHRLTIQNTVKSRRKWGSAHSESADKSRSRRAFPTKNLPFTRLKKPKISRKNWVYTRKQDRVKGWQAATPPLCVPLVFAGLVLRDGFQICLRVAVQNKAGVGQRAIVDEVIQL